VSLKSDKVSLRQI